MKVSFLALIITLICRHELITFVVDNFYIDHIFLLRYYKYHHTLVNIFFIFSDWWSISRSPDSEYYNLTHVYGESFIGAIYNVWCSRIKFCQPSWRMVNINYEVFVLILKGMNFSDICYSCMVYTFLINDFIFLENFYVCRKMQNQFPLDSLPSQCPVIYILS